MQKFDVDYPHVRQNADIVAVLAHYNIALSGAGEQRKGLCPFHDDTRPSLNVNITKNVFKCHACGSGGNVIKLVQLLNPELQNPRKAALQIAEVSKIGAKPNGNPVPTKSAVPVERVHEEPKPTVEAPAAKKPSILHWWQRRLMKGGEEVPTGATETAEVIEHNRPLTFKLQLSPIEPGGDSVVNAFVEARGIPYERLEELEIGLGQRGSMKDRLAIPIFTKDHELVAYCGRDVGLLAGSSEPKYKLPAKFRKEFELYGWHQAQNFQRVVLVESFLSVIKHGGVAAEFGEAGFGIASPMGTSLSDRQIALLVETRPQVVVCFDGDGAGIESALLVAGQLANAGLWVTTRNYSDDKKPHQDDSETFCGHCGLG